jgi:hypothetical protein
MRRIRSFTVAAMAALMTVAVILPMAARAQDKTQATTEQPKVVGVLFYADWCASCKALEPKLHNVKKQIMDQPIYFTRVDMTDECTKKQSGMFVEWVGLGEIYREHAPKTGFMLLIDAKEKKVLSKLTKTQSEAELKAAMEEALAKAK